MKIPSRYQDFPPRWETYEHFINIAGTGPLGFDCTPADTNRFGARYRAAKCFRHVKFEGFTAETAEGYTALCHILLAYSAFEHLLKCIGVTTYGTEVLLSRDTRDQVQSKLRELMGQRELFDFLYGFVDKRHKAEIKKHVSGHRCNPFFLASSIRHTFAHGVLTATPVNAPSRTVATVSRFFTRVLMKVMDREFEKRMIEFEESIAPPD